jgi:hypothetical protein
MPRKEHNIGRQRSRGNPIAINALLTHRGKRLRSLRTGDLDQETTLADIAAIDRVLVNVLAFTGDIEAVTKDFKRVAVFRRGELQRRVCDVLRAAQGPLTARQIMERIAADKGLTMRPGKLSKQWINETRKACRKVPYLSAVHGFSDAMAWQMV